MSVRKESNFQEKNMDKSFECDVCFKSFSQLPNLKIHKVTHLIDGLDDYRFDGLKEKKVTKIRRDTEEDRESYKCPECNESFRTMTIFMNHKLIHIKRKTYKCDICDKKFKSIFSLKKHNVLHALKPYQCDKCSKSFENIAALHKHNLYRHKIKLIPSEKNLEKNAYFKCEYCQRYYNYKHYLDKHIKTHHKDVTVESISVKNEASTSFVEGEPIIIKNESNQDSTSFIEDKVPVLINNDATEASTRIIEETDESGVLGVWFTEVEDSNASNEKPEHDIFASTSHIDSSEKLLDQEIISSKGDSNDSVELITPD